MISRRIASLRNYLFNNEIRKEEITDRLYSISMESLPSPKILKDTLVDKLASEISLIVSLSTETLTKKGIM